MSSTLAGLPVNRLGERRESDPQHLPSRSEGASNAAAASWFPNPGESRSNERERTMLSKLKKVGLGVAALSGAAVGGAAVAGAATSHSGTTTSGSHPPSARNMPAPGTAAHEDHEKAVTGAAADKAKAAAVKAAGGGTAGDVTTDYFGSGYEVTVTTSDGSKVEIHLDSSFNVMGPPGGGFGGPPPAQPSGTFD